MSLIQQRCWVLPKQKAWLGSLPLVLGDSCSHKLPQQPLACSALGCDTGDQPSGFTSPWGCSSQQQENSLPCSSIMTWAASLMWMFQGRGLVRPGEWLTASWWWRMKEAPAKGPKRDGRPKLCSPIPWIMFKGKAASAEQRFLTITLNWT